MQRKPRIGPLLLLVSLGSATAGFLAGWQLRDGERDQGRASPAQSRAATIDAFDSDWDEFEDLLAPEGDDERYATAPAEEAQQGGGGIRPSELLDALRRHSDSPRSQRMLLGMVADAAQAGGEMLPEIRRLLDEGGDIKFKSFDPHQPGFPSLRVALMAAAEATGDPEAARLIAEVTQASESPVEVVFGAHMLERLDALDAETAQRTLDSLARPLTKEEVKAMAAVLRKVVPAAAKADPEYAELFLTTQLRANEGKGNNTRLIAPVLDGLAYERARNVVLASVAAPDLSMRTKTLLAGRAAQRSELAMMEDLRGAIESNALDKRVTRNIAHGAMSRGSYGRLRGQTYRAIKRGDLDGALKLTQQFAARLAEANRTVQAARNTGTKLRSDLVQDSTSYQKWLNEMRARILRERQRLAKQQQKASGQ